MAKVVGPLHSSEARGSVSSLTYNTWRGISTVKARAGPTTQYSDAQVALRAKAAVATAAWKAMTDAERSLWNHYADSHPDIDWTGNPQRLSGYNWYIRINVRRQLLGGPCEDSPPSYALDRGLKTFTATSNPGGVGLAWTIDQWAPPELMYIEFYMGGPHSAGVTLPIEQAHRLGHRPANQSPYQWSSMVVGWYTFWARPLMVTGLVAGWATARVRNLPI